MGIMFTQSTWWRTSGKVSSTAGASPLMSRARECCVKNRIGVAFPLAFF